MTSSTKKDASKEVASATGTTRDSRSWFASLPTPEERAAASAITDKAFIRMFRDLFYENCRVDAHTKLPSLDEFHEMYEKYNKPQTNAKVGDSTPKRNTPTNSKKHTKAEFKAAATSEESKSDKKSHSKETGGAPVETGIVEKGESPNISTDGDVKSVVGTKTETAVVALAEETKSEEDGSLDGEAGEHTEESSSGNDSRRKDDTEATNSNLGDLTGTHDIAETIMQHVHALFSSSFSRDVSDVDRLIKQIATKGDSVAVDKKAKDNQSKRGGGKKKGTGESQPVAGEDGFEALVLDPFVTVNVFFSLADDIIKFVRNLYLLKGGSDNEGETDGFLGGRLPITLEKSNRYWPCWMQMFSNDESVRSKPIPLGILLLAGFDVAIETSYRKWLEKSPTNSNMPGKNFDDDEAFQTSLVLQVDNESNRRKEISNVYAIRRTLSTHSDMIMSYISDDDREEIHNFYNSVSPLTFNVDHLVAAPLILVRVSPPDETKLGASKNIGGKLDEKWNEQAKMVFTKLRNAMQEEKGVKQETQGISSKGKGLINSQVATSAKETSDEVASPAPKSKGGTKGSTQSKKSKKKKKKKKQKKSNSDSAASSEPTPHEKIIADENSDKTPGEGEDQIEITEKVDKTPEKSPSPPIISPSSSPESCAQRNDVPRKLDMEVTAAPLPADTKSVTSSSKELKPQNPTEYAKSEPTSSENATKGVGKSDTNDDNDDSAWETVEKKSKGRKAKSANSNGSNKSNGQNRATNGGRHDSNISASGDGGTSHGNRRGKKGKGGRDRRQNQQKKAVKEVLSHILDMVDVEVARRKKQLLTEEKRRSNSEKRNTSSNSKQQSHNEQKRKANASTSSSGNPKLTKSMRDVVVGTSASASKNNVKGKSANSTAQNKTKDVPEPPRGSKVKPGMSYKSVIEPADKPQKPKKDKPAAVSAPQSYERIASKQKEKKDETPPNNEAVSDDTEKPKQPDVPNSSDLRSAIDDDREKTVAGENTPGDDTNAPPLSTLLGPGNSCSASSSVASSLEAPHSSRFRHQTLSTTENDVGYHLLNVCGQLSEEISTFMSRRSLALDIRRRERGAVLSALQDTLGKIWPGCCHVEMYGSCATQLDLPSSDLDLVVCGLDNINMNHMNAERANSISQNSIHSIHNDEESKNQHVDVIQCEPISPNQQSGNAVHCDQVIHVDETAEEDTAMENYMPDYHVNSPEYYYVPQTYYPHLSLNAQRVLRLANELELQPWAVQVKAIPTATVPVVKMLADPSRLPGVAVPGESWLMQQHIAAQAAAAGSPPTLHEQASSPNHHFPQNQGSISSPPHYFSPPPLPTWRGADIMNGLQPVDITFEGPEHGGIGSTTYSAGVVQSACDETGLPPESTPIVQVAMVLKELLAQRRLNEPFSGGLSSYALLLLLLAVVKDRSIMQKEMEKMEKQQQEVCKHEHEDSAQSFAAAVSPKKHFTTEQRKKTTTLTAAQIVSGKRASDKHGITSDSETKDPNGTPKPSASSSWASIAKKSNGMSGRTDSTSTTKSSTSSTTTITAKTGVNSSVTLQKENKDYSKVHTSNSDTRAGKKLDFTTSKEESKTRLNENEYNQDKNQFVGENGAAEGAAAISLVTPSIEDANKVEVPLVPQGSNDVFDVLCSGDLTSGKLLMHFLLYYGQHFDSQSTLIDINGTHHSEYGRLDTQVLSPFSPRPPGGNYDPITGMYSVDPIVVYDPLEGAQDHNVAKRCYCWNNVRWVFAQCYMTVSSVVETSGTCPKASLKAVHNRDATSAKDSDVDAQYCAEGKHEGQKLSADLMTPILELLLSF